MELLRSHSGHERVKEVLRISGDGLMVSIEEYVSVLQMWRAVQHHI